MDETTFNTWLVIPRTWAHKGEQIPVKINPKRFGGVTVYGASSLHLRRPVFMTAGSTNKEDTLAFLKRIVAKLTTRKKPYLVWDRHSSHRNKLVREYVERHFHNLMTPTASCQFNCQVRKIITSPNMRRPAHIQIL